MHPCFLWLAVVVVPSILALINVWDVWVWGIKIYHRVQKKARLYSLK